MCCSIASQSISAPSRSSKTSICTSTPGRRRENFGGGRQDDPLQPPLVDVIVPVGTAQETVLKDYEIQAKRPVQLQAVVPAAERGVASTMP
jgi:hypothetical protein